jgi:hypothetical protein
MLAFKVRLKKTTLAPQIRQGEMHEEVLLTTPQTKR